jgi:tRNA-specific 2-thiouridylase
MPRKKILVALSGGVDSSVAAALLSEQGHDVSTAYMKNWINEPGLPGDCPWQQDIEDARAVALHLGLPFQIINLMEEYRQKVVSYLLGGYQSGITPNPDVMCNREIKFGAFLQAALKMGFDAVATGHYARIQRGPDGSAQLWEGLDPGKDQSYFLALLRQDQLTRAIFPVGDLLKSEVRATARRFALPTAEKKDSQGICFIGQVKMSDFLRAYVPDDPGPIVDLDGKVLGQHRGLHLYTLGQRRGVGVACAIPHHSYVVVEKRPTTKELVLAVEDPNLPALYAKFCLVTHLSFPGEAFTPGGELLVRPRYRAPAAPAYVQPAPAPDTWIVQFVEPQRALTPGQIAAFYRGQQLVAGGIISEIPNPLPPHRR